MTRTSMLACAALLFGALTGLSIADMDSDTIEPVGQRADCILTPGGSCGNKDAGCARRNGTCSVGGVHGEDGWHDGNGDGCGCQL